jgi:uncharacterized protein YbjT (DUF2867 family)
MTDQKLTIAVAGGTGTVGRHVVEVARRRGHDIRLLTRAAGIDLMTGAGLDAALAGADAVIDVASSFTQKAAESEHFFGTATANLLAAEGRASVAHHVALSIVGVDRSPHDYYAGKVVQERLVREGAVPWTLMRATQFHEFAQQVSGFHLGPIGVAPRMRTQPVAAREVAERLVDLAEAGPAGRVPDLAGPQEEWLPDMVRRYLRAAGTPRAVVGVPLPGPGGRAQRDGTLLPGAGATLGRQTFAQWLEEVAADRMEA